MRFIFLKSLIAVCVFLNVMGEAQAQPRGASAESIECRIANADHVFVAKLVDFGFEQNTDDLRFYDGTMEIEETLKEGIFHDEPDRQVRVRLPHYSRTILTHWQDQSIRLLVTVDEDDLYATRVIALTDEPLEVLTADFKVLRDPEAVIRIAKETVRRLPAPIRRIHTFRVSVPHEVVIGTKWESSDSTLELSVPVDERLEKWAQDGILSANYSTRAESARALWYFKSDENVARVKTLLNDPGFGHYMVASQNNGVDVRHYVVREAAFGTLKSWGVNVEKPVIREEVRK